jgi:5-formyltetrahydrofolate cyclo-ligase
MNEFENKENNEKQLEKSRLRNEILKKRIRLEPKDLEKGGLELVEKVTSLPIYDQARRIMVYADFRKEVPTGLLMDRILQDGKNLVLPLTDKAFQIIPYELPAGLTEWQEHLIPSSFGVPEPDPGFWFSADPETIDLILIPGSVFDEKGGRIGYGKGCYDRFLPKLRPGVPKIALAYDFQVIPDLPVDDKDVTMDKILTIMTNVIKKQAD